MNAGPVTRTVRRPASLRPGDQVALISPSSHQGRYPPEYFSDAVAALERWGLRVEVEPLAEKYLYLAGTDTQRAEQFTRLYTDPDVKALFCTRGGYGASRMLPLLNTQTIASAPPKWVVGFSDVTALFAWLQAQAGIAVMHGPCLAAPSAVSSPRREDNMAALRKALFEPGARTNYAVEWLRGLQKKGNPAVGRLVGGCLTVLVTTLGTPWEIDTRDALLFLEDTDEAPYRIDRMITHLRTAGKLRYVRGVVFGHLQRCDSSPPGLLNDVLEDLFRDATYPVAHKLPCGHGDLNLPLEFGAVYELAETGGEARLIQR